MVKVWVDGDELYPIYYVKEEKDICWKEIDVTPNELNNIKHANKMFFEMQKLIESKIDANTNNQKQEDKGND